VWNLHRRPLRQQRRQEPSRQLNPRRSGRGAGVLVAFTRACRGVHGVPLGRREHAQCAPGGVHRAPDALRGHPAAGADARALLPALVLQPRWRYARLRVQRPSSLESSATRGTLCAHAYGLRDESPEPSTDPTPACPFCLRRGSLIADGTLEAWRNARVYRCARCHTEWAVAPQDHEPKPGK
jgi:hypothetical protein